MSVVTDRRIPDSPVNQHLPLAQLLLMGFQHVPLMYGGTVVVPLIVGQAAGLSREEIAFLINADLLVADIATLVRSLGVGPMDIRMPVVMGASFAAVGSMVAIAGVPGVDIIGIFGATITTGFFGTLIAPFMSRIMRFFPSLATGMVITSIGVCLFPVAINWADGGKSTENFGSLHFLFLSNLVLCTILLIDRFMRGFQVSISVLMDVGLGYAIADGMGMIGLDGLTKHPWSDIVTPLHSDAPTFNLAPILPMYLVVAIIFVESTGMFPALGKIIGREITLTELRRGLLCDAGASLFAGFLNAFTHSSFTQNIGLVQMTRVRSCYVTVAAAGFLILLGMLPKAAFLVASIPPAVFSGADIAMFGVIAASGIQVLHKAGTTDHRNQLLVVINIGIGMIPVVHPDFFARLPVWMESITHSGIAITAIWAAVLDLLFNILSRNGHSHLCGSHVPTPKHS